jgi:tetratricopeptide (TPR) repeat protein
MPIHDKKHWSKQSEAARDEVKDALEEAIDWLIVNRRTAGWTLAGAALAGLLFAAVVYGRRARADAAWDKLSQAELLAYSGRPQAAEDILQQLDQAGGSPAAVGLGRLLQGDLQYPRGGYDQALAAYKAAAEDAPDTLKPFALADTVMTLEAAGKNAECAAAAQSFLDAHPENILAVPVRASLARCQLAAGQTEAAQATLQKIVLESRDTPWGAWAASRLQPATK